MTLIRTVLGIMKQEFGWEYSLDNDFKFTGGLSARMKKLFNERSKQFPAVSTFG